MVMLNGLYSGALNFHLGIGVRPEGRNKGAIDRITAEFGTLVNWISRQTVALSSLVLPWSNLKLLNGTVFFFFNFEALELKISRNLR